MADGSMGGTNVNTTTIRWWRTHATRFRELVLFDLRGAWRFGAVVPGEDPQDANVVGPTYRTKVEALADLDRYARFYGCEGSK